MTDWGRAAIRVDQAHEALGHRMFEAAWAVFVSNPALPDIHTANYVRSVTAASPGEVKGLLARAEREFAGSPHRCFEVDLDTPPPFEGRLVFEGYEARVFILMVLEGGLHGRPRAADLRLVTDERGWAEARAKVGREPLPKVGSASLSWPGSRRRPTASGSPVSTARRAGWPRPGAARTGWGRWRMSSSSRSTGTADSRPR